VARGRALLLEDARIDPDFHDNPMVRKLGVAAYAGVPLIVAGRAIGTLCVMDREARVWEEAQLRLLGKLTEGLAYDIELRLAGAQLARSALLTEAHNRIHELIAADEPLPHILSAIIRSIETHDPALYGSVLLLDATARTLHHGGASRLPDAYLEQIEGVAIGPAVGSCGTAAYTGREVISHDLETDPRWEGYRHIAEPFGLRHCWSFPVVGSDGAVLGTFAVYGMRPRSPSDEDLSFLRDSAKLAGIAIERRRTQDQLVFDATHDSLTGLSNRATAFARLSDMLHRYADGPVPVSVLFVDLDRLKVINDSLGHDTGDRVIREVAQRLDRCAGPELVARIGGEEFLIVAVCGHEQAATLAQRALSELRTPVQGRRAEQDLTITASIGIAVIADGSTDPQEAMRRADAAMYAAKARGGNTYAWSDAGDVSAAGRRLQIETALRHAVDREELGLVFQPLHRFADGRTVAVEALARWSHPVLGPVGPDEFIPIAEQTGLIHAIGAYVLNAACEHLPALVALHGPELRLAVNVSAQQLRDPTLPRMVAETLAAHRMPPRRLDVEITETALLSPDPGTAETVGALHEMRVNIVLDDFGTGYSSPTILKRHPVAAIKIDRSFVEGVTANRDDLAIATALIGMAKGLGLSIVAEGIETQQQYETLRDLGCHTGQGFLLGRPRAILAARVEPAA
jgi:diguanylate cyclase (GGDEF)-like protein